MKVTHDVTGVSDFSVERTESDIKLTFNSSNTSLCLVLNFKQASLLVEILDETPKET